MVNTNANRLALVTLALASLVAPIAWGAFRPVRLPSPAPASSTVSAPTKPTRVTVLEEMVLTPSSPVKVTVGHVKKKCNRKEERRPLLTGGMVTAWWCELAGPTGDPR